MKFCVERAAFLDTVSKLQKVTGAKTSMPILDGILLSAESGLLTMAAYNLEIGMKKELYVKCDEAGDIVINARLLGDILRRMTGIQVEIEADEKLMCYIRCGEAEFNIMGMQASEFPEMPSVADGAKVSIDGQTLCDMVRGTIFAVSQIEGTRPILTGVNVRIKDGVLQLVAIDGYRLAVRRKKANIDGDFEFIVTGRAISEVVKLIDEETENVEIIAGKKLISFTVNGYVFISRLLEGEFVNFEKIIPDEFQQRVTVNCHDITDTVERVSLLINDTFSTPVRFNFAEERAIISSKTAMGSAKETLNLLLDGVPFEIGLNSRYLLDALKACDSGDIQFTFNGPNAGVTITSADIENKDFLYLIMPMRLK